ncbi:MAG TPA: acetyl-CoA carboxylase, carboxyltransferase subunit beta [Armatimonadota bacterium]|mgnify:CR=1 FL=1|nr:acetyl-CoA carboxylase carboxyltransferase subunit beta [Armatimonadota bacterium]HOJ20474.1 acetyl-CoA carboxylase, carboxyltransferase subunit beta [Armatimonadota bacterium]HOM81089.1 acetyl-CoA carboxylase, carboxyltransferase subunit beta [Armatimonadota bacterium]HPO71357.1 acetyl-CoA carboxylase, carboxyltransferase subunit beta [Armatimonadota bacterium]
MAPNGWFHRYPRIKGGGEPKAQHVPEGIFEKCPKCGEALLVKELEKNLKVCRKCGYHFRLSVRERIELLTDPGSFQEIATGLSSVDILEFPEYPEKLAKGRANTGLNDGMVVGSARIAGWPVILGVADFRFMGGSMGSVYGERVTRALEEALQRRVPAILVCASGGARMQEGLVSLMQMAKTSAAVGRLNEAGVPYITVLTDPTTAGVFASFASLGDIIIAEPGALMRFAGERVAAQAGPAKQPPPNFQTAEFYLEHGAIDLIVHRKDLQDTLSRILTFCCHGRLAREGGEALAAVR